jgi:hypothetical protein
MWALTQPQLHELSLFRAQRGFLARQRFMELFPAFQAVLLLAAVAAIEVF